LHLAIGVRPLNANVLSTPPRSPTKTSFTPTQSSSPSPHRAHVPSTILEQPLFEEAASMDSNEAGNGKDAKEGDNTVAEEVEKGTALRRAETIRVYAEKDVFALMADVKNTIDEMTGNDGATKDSSTSLSDTERRKICRTLSHDALTSSPARKPLPISKLEEKPSYSSLTFAATATPPAAAEPPAAEMFLTSAVFKPS
jgi:hypothetical protein